MSAIELGSGRAQPRLGRARRLQARLTRLVRTPHPTQVGVLAFAVAVLVVTLLLMLPVAAEPGSRLPVFAEVLAGKTPKV